MEVGSLSGSALAQASQTPAPQQVTRNDQVRNLTELESPAPQQNSPQPGQRVGSIVDTQA